MTNYNTTTTPNKNVNTELSVKIISVHLCFPKEIIKSFIYVVI